MDEDRRSKAFEDGHSRSYRNERSSSKVDDYDEGKGRSRYSTERSRQSTRTEDYDEGRERSRYSTKTEDYDKGRERSRYSARTEDYDEGRERSKKNKKKKSDKSKKSKKDKKGKYKDYDSLNDRSRRSSRKSSSYDKYDSSSDSSLEDEPSKRSKQEEGDSNEIKEGSDEVQPKLVRESWMELDDNLFAGGTNTSRKNKEDTKEGTTQKYQYANEGLVVSKRELNPYLTGELSHEVETVDSNQADQPVTKQAVDPNLVNQLQAKVLRAKLTRSKDLPELQNQLDALLNSNHQSVNVAQLPNYDMQGNVVDVGNLNQPKQYTKKTKANVSDQSDLTIQEMVQLEKLDSNLNDQDTNLAHRISKDAKFNPSLDYLDSNSDRLAQPRQRSENVKRMLAVNDYKKVSRALDSCLYCFRADNQPPQVPLISVGHHLYLTLPPEGELVDGHCTLAFAEHHTNSLLATDQEWIEVRNFMKSLTITFDRLQMRPLFFELVQDNSSGRHTTLQCIPVPTDVFELLPKFFEEAILENALEWSTHLPIQDTNKRGFRNSLSSKANYFHVWFNLDGGLAHVIEGKFNRNLPLEVLVAALDLDPFQLNLRKLSLQRSWEERIQRFNKTAKYWKLEDDWTKLLDA